MGICRGSAAVEAILPEVEDATAKAITPISTQEKNIVSFLRVKIIKLIESPIYDMRRKAGI